MKHSLSTLLILLLLSLKLLIQAADDGPEAEPYNTHESIGKGGLLGFSQEEESNQLESVDNATESGESEKPEKYGGCPLCEHGSSDNDDHDCCQPQTTTVTLTLTWSTIETSFATSFIFSSTTITSTIVFTSSVPGPTFYFTYSYTSLTTSSSTTTSTTTSSTTTSTTTTSTITISTSTLQTITIY